jgi:hypothetical protein
MLDVMEGRTPRWIKLVERTDRTDTDKLVSDPHHSRLLSADPVISCMLLQASLPDKRMKAPKGDFSHR